MSTEFRKASLPLNRIGISMLHVYLKYKYNISYDNLDLKKIKPPYLILANHTNNLDPFIIGTYVKQPIYFVTSDEQFRYPIRGFFMSKLVRAIPKKKFVADIITVKEIIKIVKNNGIVGIFPEGQRSWDGKTLELVPSTSKLVKLLGIPVVTVILEGAHLARPRWSSKNRKGKIHLNYKYILSPSKIKNMTIEQIDTELNTALYHNEYEKQKQNMNTYTSAKLTENLELFLFTCPHCKSIGDMHSRDNLFYCEKCNYSVIYNKYGFFDKVDSEMYFEYPSPWDRWQIENLEFLMNNTNNVNEPILKDENVTVFVSSRLKPLEKIFHGNIALNSKYFYLENSSEEFRHFEVTKISGLNVQYNNQFEFYYDEQLFRFIFDSPTTSAYKWTSALNIFNENSNKKKYMLVEV